VCITSLLVSTIATAGQERDLKKRLTPAEVDAVQTEVAGAGTSGLPAVTTRILFGDPTKPGLYTIELRIAPNTTIQAHTHRDTRTAVVVDGLWYFGYGPKNEPSLEKGLERGSFYTEPAGQSHFARTGSKGATVAITGYGPTDTVYAK
jgi:quercetin dioxygenase-like cupin family protein